MSRLPPSRGERVDRTRTVSFTFDGERVEAFGGDTIGSALHAADHRVLSRSFKYHRPRGLFCCAGQCPNCLVDVDGWPGVRACTEPVREGMKVEHMNARPSLRFDVMRATDIFGSRLTPRASTTTFIRPRRLWPLYEKVLRNAAGLGKLARRQKHREWRTEYRRRHADVLVIGGGVAGMSAALRAAELGADVCSPTTVRSSAGQRCSAMAPTRSTSWRSAFAPPGSRCWRRPLRSATSTASCPSGRRARCTRSEPSATSRPPARSSSR